MPAIASDKDLPKPLDNPMKQTKRAKKLVMEHLGSVIKSAEKPPLQGMFSRTYFVTLADACELVVQYRTEPLNTNAFKLAKDALGSFVPDARALPRK
ncbi:hypothetical protein AAL_01394 [Moelleriella libera RCEF 2490]|uniref:Uncharacterized protein n=1 Tax=Moelleriella libera RCEF 2490 TaxID=1081109 RepID=A0A166U4W6_9HYPO|nr:hypothetical protein AAL_01394 [Moelleriella libera RCEF 2490]